MSAWYREPVPASWWLPVHGLRTGTTALGPMLQALVPVIDGRLQWINVRMHDLSWGRRP